MSVAHQYLNLQQQVGYLEIQVIVKITTTDDDIAISQRHLNNIIVIVRYCNCVVVVILVAVNERAAIVLVDSSECVCSNLKSSASQS